MDSNDEDAPPTEEEIKELWRKNRFNVWRQEDFHRGRTIHVVFHRKPLMTPEYWNTPVPDTVRVHAVGFSKTVKHGTELIILEDGHDIYETVMITEIQGNGVVVERTRDRVAKQWRWPFST
jgi:hypothetical protein